ncbi:MAG: hypothetical protein JXB49_18625 [Bacteroidales bacterium]|nr:hypothetical protein [Bacteroidales bacterium]
MKTNDDKLEKRLTAVFATVGIIAVVINLFVKGINTEHLLDALKDLAGLVVVIAVFLLASKIFRKSRHQDFNHIFEKHLKEWIDQNRYLVDENFDSEGKGKFKKRYCSMMIDHANLVTKKKFAKDAAPNKEKGAFVYLPYKDNDGNWKNEFDFRFNERTFSRQDIFRNDDNSIDLKKILEEFSRGINDNFEHLGIRAKPLSSTIQVSFEKMEQTVENAKRLIDMIEYVKTMVLALA